MALNLETLHFEVVDVVMSICPEVLRTASSVHDPHVRCTPLKNAISSPWAELVLAAWQLSRQALV